MFNFYPSSHNTKCSFPEHTNSTFFPPAFFESKEEHEEKENLFSREKELSFPSYPALLLSLNCWW